MDDVTEPSTIHHPPSTAAKRRLAVAFEFPTLSGGERSMLAVLSRPSADGWEVVALAPPAGPLAEELRRLGVEVVPFDLRESGNKPPPEWAAEMLGEAVGRCGADLVHANSLSMARVTGRWSRRTGRPATGHVRDMMRLSKAAVADVNANAAVLCVSAATREYHLAQGLDAERSRVVRNGVDVPPLGACSLREQIAAAGPASEPPDNSRFDANPQPALRTRRVRATQLIATVGQICLRKGHDTAAEALRGLDVPHRWLLVGERFSQKPESAAFDAALDGPNVVRLGYRRDVFDILRQVDLLLHPARQEPFGRVLLEASAVGCPVVATDVGGTREMLGDYATLVPPDDPAAMRAAVLKTLNKPRPQPLRRFTVEACAEKTWAAWRAV